MEIESHVFLGEVGQPRPLCCLCSSPSTPELSADELPDDIANEMSDIPHDLELSHEDFADVLPRLPDDLQDFDFFEGMIDFEMVHKKGNKFYFRLLRQALNHIELTMPPSQLWSPEIMPSVTKFILEILITFVVVVAEPMMYVCVCTAHMNVESVLFSRFPMISRD